MRKASGQRGYKDTAAAQGRIAAPETTLGYGLYVRGGMGISFIAGMRWLRVCLLHLNVCIDTGNTVAAMPGCPELGKFQ
jgi:hypothetical protein